MIKKLMSEWHPPHRVSYFTVWTRDNHINGAAVAVVRNDGILVGHVPANLASIMFHFLSRDGNNGFAEITGNKGAGYGL